MITAFINIRFKQLYRVLSGIGLFRTIILAIFLGAPFIYVLYVQATVTPYSVIGVYFAVVALIHINRSDKLFLKIHFDNYKLIFGVEYLLLSLPLLICLIFYHQWSAILVSLILLFLIPNLEISRKSRNLNTNSTVNYKSRNLIIRLQQWIPDDSFEWKAEIRKILFLVIIVWILGMGTSFFIAGAPIAIFILGILQPGANEKSESLPMVLAFEMKTNKFLFHKIKLQVAIFSTLVIPLIILFLIFHPERWYIPVAEYLILVSYQIYLILTKYAFYRPNTKSQAVFTFAELGGIGILIPVFLPLLWFLSVWFYKKSFKNLDFYLHDYN